MSKIDHIRDWLVGLSFRISPSLEPDEIAGRVNMLAEDLADEFTVEAFTRASMLHVARANPRYWPSFGEICDVLAPWWREHRPLPPALPEPAPEPPRERTPDELQHVGEVTRRVLAELQQHNVEQAARLARSLPALQRPTRELTRAQLTEAYKRAGLQGPTLPKVAEIVPWPGPKGAA